MKPISWQRWAATFAILILLGLLADYFFLHLLFDPSQRAHTAPAGTVTAPTENGETAAPGIATGEVRTKVEEPTSATAKPDNFLKTLQTCRPEISSQGVATPEALITYLAGSIGKQDEIVEIENFIFNLPNGEERRVHLIPKENSNSKTERELRYFKVDEEGYPERLELSAEQKQLPVDQLTKVLVSQGELKRHQVKSAINLRDGSFLSLEKHNEKIYEFQWRHSVNEPTLSCRHLNCVCL